ncbi:MAG: hypothetical protein AAFU49_10130 [Pseudomonadota bacterium]
MANTAALIDVQKDSKKHAAFEKYLDKKKLGTLYDFVRLHRDEKTAYRVGFKDASTVEKTFSKGIIGRVKQIYDAMVNQEITTRMNGGSIPRDQADAFLNKIYSDIVQTPKWKQTFKAAMVGLNQRFSAEAANEFPHSPEYAAWYRSKVEADAKKAAKDLELEKELDAFLGLAVSVRTGDSAGSKRFSQQLAKTHKPKKGKGMSPAQFISYVKSKFKKS